MLDGYLRKVALWVTRVGAYCQDFGLLVFVDCRTKSGDTKR